jgi:hypothetical protein
MMKNEKEYRSQEPEARSPTQQPINCHKGTKALSLTTPSFLLLLNPNPQIPDPKNCHEGTKTQIFYCFFLNPKSQILNPKKDHLSTRIHSKFQRLVRWLGSRLGCFFTHQLTNTLTHQQKISFVT